MVVFPNAKINLGLRIKSKRADGFHNLDTVFYPLPFTDALEIIPQSTPSETPVIFSSSGLVIPGETHKNLCFKEYHLLKNKFPEKHPNGRRFGWWLIRWCFCNSTNE